MQATRPECLWNEFVHHHHRRLRGLYIDCTFNTASWWCVCVCSKGAYHEPQHHHPGGCLPNRSCLLSSFFVANKQTNLPAAKWTREQSTENLSTSRINPSSFIHGQKWMDERTSSILSSLQTPLPHKEVFEWSFGRFSWCSPVLARKNKQNLEKTMEFPWISKFFHDSFSFERNGETPPKRPFPIGGS